MHEITDARLLEPTRSYRGTFRPKDPRDRSLSTSNQRSVLSFWLGTHLNRLNTDGTKPKSLSMIDCRLVLSHNRKVDSSVEPTLRQDIGSLCPTPRNAPYPTPWCGSSSASHLVRSPSHDTRNSPTRNQSYRATLVLNGRVFSGPTDARSGAIYVSSVLLEPRYCQQLWSIRRMLGVRTDIRSVCYTG